MSHRCQVDVTVVSLCHYLNNFQFILILIRPVLGRENRRILGVIYPSISNADHHLRPRDGFLYFFTFYTCDLYRSSQWLFIPRHVLYVPMWTDCKSYNRQFRPEINFAVWPNWFMTVNQSLPRLVSLAAVDVSLWPDSRGLKMFLSRAESTLKSNGSFQVGERVFFFVVVFFTVRPTKIIRNLFPI